MNVMLSMFSSVAVNTSIYQSSSAAVFILAVFLLGESITLIKVIYTAYVVLQLWKIYMDSLTTF